MSDTETGGTPELDALFCAKACPDAQAMIREFDGTDERLDRAIAHIENCEACLQAFVEALDAYLK